MKIIKKIEGKRIDLCLNEIVEAVPAKKFVDCLNYDIVLKGGDIIGSISAKLGMNDAILVITFLRIIEEMDMPLRRLNL